MGTSDDRPKAGKPRNAGGDVQGKGVTLDTEESGGGDETTDDAGQQPADAGAETGA